MLKKIICFLVLTLFLSGHSQRQKDSLLNTWEDRKLADSTRADALNEVIVKYYLNTKPDSAYITNKKLELFIQKNNLSDRLGEVLNNYGVIETSIGNEAKAIDFFEKALEFYKKQNDLKGQASVLNNIGTRYSSNWNFKKALDYYEESLGLNRFLKDSTQITLNLINIGNVYSNRFKLDEALKYYNESLDISRKTGDLRNGIIAQLNMGDLYFKFDNEEKGKILIDETILKSENYGYIDIKMNALHMLMAHNYLKKNYDKSINYGNKCLKISSDLNNEKMLENCYNLFYEIYTEKGDFKEANSFLVKKIKLIDGYQKIKSRQKLQKLEVSRIRTKDSLINVANTYKAEMAYQKEKTNLTIAWGGSLSAVSIIALLVYRNTKRKQRKAEEERKKQIEEKEKILKDLELSTIDAMIQGQEKERQRLAAELHDSVGATLSAAKLQFNHLIKDEIDIKVREELIKKTSTLLEDAYVEIRSMAHLKNSGVIAKNGLLPAVVKLAENASGANSLKFEVQSHGLEERIDNSLEISIFRIIQELVTNIIKHANATKGIIHLTNHDDSINIMIEDNGKGFNPSQVTKTNKGMGISSIDKRVEHLDGKLTIESEKDKGTTVIIDIPL